MSSGIITINKVKYAAGLYWQPSAEAKNIAKAAKDAARQPGFQADFYCVREPTKSQPIGQFGLGIASAGHKDGMPSIAACLVGQHLGSWAGVFRVPEGVYFIAVREDLIDPDGDALFTEENEAQARLEQEIARGGLLEIICPSEWGVHSSQSSPIGAVLAGRKDVTLRSVSIGAKNLLQFALLFILIGIGIGGYLYYQDMEAKKEAEEQAAQAAMEQARLRLGSPKEYPKTWEYSPLPLAVIAACEHAAESIQPKYLGWALDSFECTPGGGMNMIWKRVNGSSAVIPVDGKATVDTGFASATYTVPLEKLEPRGPETLASIDLINQSILQKNLPVLLSSLPDDVLPAPKDKDAPPPPPPPWRKQKIIYTFKGAPWERPELFDTLPGLIIDTIKAQGNFATFTVEGTVYENKQP